METLVDVIMATSVALIAIASLLLNVCLANACRYYKTCSRCDLHERNFWKETALLYQKQMHEAADERV